MFLLGGASDTRRRIARPTGHDHPGWRLAFHVLHEHGPRWVTLWLVLIIGGLVALGAVAGPWVPGAITAIGLIAGGAAIARRLGGPAPASTPDPAGSTTAMNRRGAPPDQPRAPLVHVRDGLLLVGLVAVPPTTPVALRRRTAAKPEASSYDPGAQQAAEVADVRRQQPRGGRGRDQQRDHDSEGPGGAPVVRQEPLHEVDPPIRTRLTPAGDGIGHLRGGGSGG